MMKRFLFVLAFGLLCVPATASAAERYAEPAGNGAEPCLQADPCSLAGAINGASNGDEVIVLPGAYTSSSPLIIQSAIDVHGPETGARPTVTSTNTAVQVVTLADEGAKLRNLDLVSGSLGIYLSAGTMDRVFSHATGDGGTACSIRFATPSATATNSVCWASGAGSRGFGGDGLVSSPEFTLRNVTASGTQTGIEINNAASSQVTLQGTNVIADGGTADVSAVAAGTVTMNFDHSNYATVVEQGAGASITDAGSGTNQLAPPVFVNAASGDFHQTAASPTVDAGADDLLNGLRDIDGEARTQAFATDIGADERPDALPTAVDDSATVAENSSANPIPLLANDTDTDGGPKEIRGVTSPINGNVDFTSSTLTYTPAPGYCGPDTFTYALNGDSLNSGSTATVTLTVNCRPTAVADARTVARNAAAATINVLANDTDTDGGAKSIASATDPAHGTVSTTPTSLTYKPDAGYCGPDSFTYTLNGGSTATVSVTVTCPPKDTKAPNTIIKKHPRARTRSHAGTFRFKSTEAGSKFKCKLDKRAWRRCASPKTYTVGFGRHVFKVKAIDQAGNVDPTPAVIRWRVVRG